MAEQRDMEGRTSMMREGSMCRCRCPGGRCTAAENNGLTAVSKSPGERLGLKCAVTQGDWWLHRAEGKRLLGRIQWATGGQGTALGPPEHAISPLLRRVSSRPFLIPPPPPPSRVAFVHRLKHQNQHHFTFLLLLGQAKCPSWGPTACLFISLPLLSSPSSGAMEHRTSASRPSLLSCHCRT